MHQPETRASLILRLKGERNELAWTEFVSTYESFLRQLVGRQGVAERDVAVEAAREQDRPEQQEGDQEQPARSEQAMQHGQGHGRFGIMGGRLGR